MTKYRDQLTKDYGADVGSVVGCGLDRLDRGFTYAEIVSAINFYEANKAEIDALAIGDRRQRIANLFLSSPRGG